MKASMQARQFVLTEAPSPSAPLPDGEAPPPYDTLPPTTSLSQSLPTTQAPMEGAGCFPVGWQDFKIEGSGTTPCHRLPTDVKLGYMDFVPRLTKKKVFQDNEYENFRYVTTCSYCFLLSFNCNCHLQSRGISCMSVKKIVWQ